MVLARSDSGLGQGGGSGGGEKESDLGRILMITPAGLANESDEEREEKAVGFNQTGVTV